MACPRKGTTPSPTHPPCTTPRTTPRPPTQTWMLDSFRALDARVLAPAGRPLTEWVFLEVHAEGEAEHAAIGHDAVAAFVPAAEEATLRAAIRDHDRDMAAFYGHLADLMSGPDA